VGLPHRIAHTSTGPAARKESTPSVPDLQSLLSAAERAAAAGEHASAERHLREAAALQAAHLGPLHPDLATTLNNLAVACELADNPVDAERYFRRAYEIARTVLDAGHPFVATSRRNLEEFCAARGRPVELPDPASTAVAPAPAVTAGPSPAPAEKHRTTNEPPDRDRRGRSRARVVAAVAATLLLALAAATWLRSSDPPASSPAPAVSAEREATTSQPVTSEPSEPPGTALDLESDGGLAEQPHAATAATAGATLDADGPSVAGPTPQGTVVAIAQLCRTLSTGGREWRCVPAASSLEPGALFFYTRLRSPRPMAVQHRWYQGDRVQKVVDLSIGANSREGYRTYSRHTVGARNAGDWRVELVTRDGTLLHEERFVIR
jgi:hypothetical protein